MKFDRDAYFDQVRASLFGGSMTQQQVDGQNVLLACWEFQEAVAPMDDLRWLAYMLATTYHETAATMWPIEEYGKGAGHPYGEPDPETGQTYYGRGDVMITWKENYEKATAELGLGDTPRDLVWHPERALDTVIAARIMFAGMREGWFTGHALGDFFNDTTDDPVGARQIVNGHDKDELIAGYHDAFMTALVASFEDVPVKPPLSRVTEIELRVQPPARVAVNDQVVEVKEPKT